MSGIPPSGSTGPAGGLHCAPVLAPPSPLTSAVLTSRKQAWRALGRSPLGCLQPVEVPLRGRCDSWGASGETLSWRFPRQSLDALGPPPCWPSHSTPFSPVQFSRSVVSNSLQPHGPQQARPPCPLPTPGVYSDSCPLSRWCHSRGPRCLMSHLSAGSLHPSVQNSLRSCRVKQPHAGCVPQGLICFMGNKHLCCHWNQESTLRVAFLNSADRDSSPTASCL